ncbi:MAG: hypothetical protein ACJ781_13810, partial [Myxococcales bacterium]
PTMVHHRSPENDLLEPYPLGAALATKLHALTLTGGEYQTHDYYMNIGPTFADPVARQLYAEIASIEEQHVTQYECLADPSETWLEKWVLHEANEVYNYWCCAEQESNPRVRAIWERFLDYELGHLAVAREAFEKTERRDVAAILPQRMPERIRYESQRQFVRKVLANEVELRASGTEIVEREPKNSPSAGYRRQMNSQGSPTETIAAGYAWRPGTELSSLGDGRGETLQ